MTVSRTSQRVLAVGSRAESLHKRQSEMEFAHLIGNCASVMDRSEHLRRILGAELRDGLRYRVRASSRRANIAEDSENGLLL